MKIDDIIIRIKSMLIPNKVKNKIDTFLKSSPRTLSSIEEYRNVLEYTLKYKTLLYSIGVHNGRLMDKLFDHICEYENPKDAVDILDKLYPIYEKAEKYQYELKSIIHDYWADMLINLGREPEAYDHLIKTTYFTFIDNMSYQGFDFFSFRSFTKYALDDIKNNTLSFSHPGLFNDPMDTPIIRFNDIIRDQIKDEDMKKKNLLLSKVYDHIKVRCFVRTHPLPMSHTEENYVKEQRIEDVNALMWAHYADYHKGFCVKYCFDKDFILNNDETTKSFSRIGNVNYQSDMKIESGLRIRDALFMKHNVWKYENEVRIVHFDPNNNDDFKLLKINPNNIKEIYLGLRCSDENKYRMFQILRGRSIPIYQMKLDKSNPFKLIAERIG